MPIGNESTLNDQLKIVIRMRISINSLKDSSIIQ